MSIFSHSIENYPLSEHTETAFYTD